MGHVRVGRLPKTYHWNQLVALLELNPDNTAAVAAATIRAAERRLAGLGNDQALGYCFWLLTRLAAAGRAADLVTALDTLGLRANETTSAIGFIAAVSDHVRAEMNRHPESGPFGEMASLALRRTLSDTIGSQGPGMLDSTVADLQYALRSFSTDRQFGLLSRRFFGNFLPRTLRFYVDKELANCVGPGHTLTTVHQADAFSRALDVHARQSAVVLQDFARGWFSKRSWQAHGRISQAEARAFVAVAVRKVRRELRQEARR